MPNSGYDFLTHLARFGPEGLEKGSPLSLAQARAYTVELARSHYENFPVMSWLAPRALRSSIAAVYAFCRWSDDLGDEVGDPARSLALLDWWREEVNALYAGQARHPVLIALAESVDRYSIPPQPFLDLISAFRQDQLQTRYESVGELLDYCRRSANPVGRIMLYLMRCHTPDRMEAADALCTGLQWANFCQDVAVDYFDKGRLYLPMASRERHGVDEDVFRRRECTPEFVALMTEEVRRAESHLVTGLGLAATLRGRFRLLIALMGHGGLAILRKIRRMGYNVLQQRPRLSRWDRLGGFVNAAMGRRLAMTPPDNLSTS